MSTSANDVTIRRGTGILPVVRAVAAVAMAVAVWAWAAAGTALAVPEKQVSPEPSRTPAYHRIELFDEDKEPIKPDSSKPFSQRVSCNKCHDYDIISGGWHFNEADPKVAPGRAGEAWIYTDVATGTQVPVTNRDWPGAFKPAQVGLSAWKFVQMFGGHFPGGGVGEKFAGNFPDKSERWLISGNVEINCLGCHNRSSQQDGTGYAAQMGAEDFRWAGTAGSALAFVTGYAKGLPNTYDPLLGESPDSPQNVPKVQYYKDRFDPKNQVFLDTVRKAPAERCYFCHTNHLTAEPEWKQLEDVHVARGFRCDECHTTGLNHAIARGYEGEKAASAGFSCRGCHLGESAAMTAALRKGGHGAAPRPKHAGLPEVHLNKLSCTACHSGPWPLAEAQRVQTSRSHGLGDHAMPYDPNAAPYIREPVFVKSAFDGKITPCRVMFPAYWGRLKDGKVSPIAPADVAAACDALQTPKDKKPKPPTGEQVAAGLKALAGDKAAGEAVFVSAGKLYKLDAAGELAASDHAAAQPYAWPLAHDVRPAVQALGYGGAEGCKHCHATDSAFMFGKLPAEGLAKLGEPASVDMCGLQQGEPELRKLLAVTFVFRPWLKGFGFTAAGVLVLILLAYGLPAVAAILRRFSGRVG